MTEMTKQFRWKLLDLWEAAHLFDDLPKGEYKEDFLVWSTATKKLLAAMGMEWDPAMQEQTFRDK
jgi:hypothetical protein